MSDNELVLAAVGDVVFARDEPSRAFDGVREALQDADLRYCNLEVPLSDEGMPQHAKFETLHSSPAMIDGYVAGGFEIVSLANNHTMDYGPVALMDTIRLLDEHGIVHMGAGPDRAAAWNPVQHTAGGVTLGLASFASEAYPGYGATEDRPGIAMLRRDPLYGEAAISPDDMRAMQDTIARAAEGCDRVIAFLHWGLSQSRHVTVSQRALARAAVEAGADLVIGHHPHILQAVELLDGVPIIYSLGNFVFDMRPHFFGRATDYTALAKVRFGADGAPAVSMLPVHIGPEGDPTPVALDDERGARVLGELRDLSRGLATVAPDVDRGEITFAPA